jgi:hypothetical protein
MKTNPLLLFILSCAFLGIGNPLPSVATTWTVEVPSSIPWFDTGIDVTAGQFLEINASGTVRFDTTSIAGVDANGLGLAGTVRKHWQGIRFRQPFT